MGSYTLACVTVIQVSVFCYSSRVLILDAACRKCGIRVLPCVFMCFNPPKGWTLFCTAVEDVLICSVRWCEGQDDQTGGY